MTRSISSPPEYSGTHVNTFYQYFDNSTVWECVHTIESDEILVSFTDTEYNTILPYKAIKVDNNTFTVSFLSEVSGYASVIKITPLLKHKRIKLSNKSNITIQHRFQSTYLICQFWENNQNYILPKSTSIIDMNSIYIEFDDIFSGIIDIIVPYPNQKNIDVLSSSWKHMYRTDIDKNLIVTQAWIDYNLILPQNIKKIGDTPQQSEIQIDYPSKQVGDMNSLIHGYRI